CRRGPRLRVAAVCGRLVLARPGRGGLLPCVPRGLAGAVVLLGALPVVVVLEDNVGGGGETVPAAVGDRAAERLRFLAHRAERPLPGFLLTRLVEQRPEEDH